MNVRGGPDGEKRTAGRAMESTLNRENLFARRPRRPDVDAKLDGRIVEGDVEALDLGVERVELREHARLPRGAEHAARGDRRRIVRARRAAYTCTAIS